MRTTIVLSAFADLTMPWRTRGLPGPCSLAGAVVAEPFSPVAAGLALAFSRRRWRAALLRAWRSSRSAMCCSIVFCSGICLLLALQFVLDVDAALASDRQTAREVALRRAHTGGVLELAGGVLKA